MTVPISAKTKRLELYMNVINSRTLIFPEKLNMVSPPPPILPDFNICFGLNLLGGHVSGWKSFVFALGSSLRMFLGPVP